MYCDRQPFHFPHLLSLVFNVSVLEKLAQLVRCGVRLDLEAVSLPLPAGRNTRGVTKKDKVQMCVVVRGQELVLL